MKLFFTFLVAIFICCQGVFAVTAKTAKSQREQQESQKKMEQLQQLLARAIKSGNSSVPPPIPEMGLDQNRTSTEQVSATKNNNSLVPASVPERGLGQNGAYVGQIPATKSRDSSMLPSVPETGQELYADVTNSSDTKSNLYDEAFSSVVNQLLPMSPPQIAKLREVFTESQLAAATLPGIPSKPTSTSLLVDLSPKATPPVIRLGPGIITSLVFVDGTGQPWPIASYSVGDPTSTNIQWDRKSNILLMQSSTFYKRSNLAVILRDLSTPVMITLISGQAAVDYRVDLRIPGFGPNAVFVQNGIPESANPILLEVLNGIPPNGSKEVMVSGGDCQAWLLKKKLYLRTSLNIISPGWQSIMSSIDGTHAYQLQPSPVILALKNGRDKILTLTLDLGINP